MNEIQDYGQQNIQFFDEVSIELHMHRPKYLNFIWLVLSILHNRRSFEWRPHCWSWISISGTISANKVTERVNQGKIRRNVAIRTTHLWTIAMFLSKAGVYFSNLRGTDPKGWHLISLWLSSISGGLWSGLYLMHFKTLSTWNSWLTVLGGRSTLVFFGVSNAAWPPGCYDKSKFC